MNTIPECFYRISVTALILNEQRDKFLICQEEDGFWELPGGGLDWGMTPQEDLPREIEEEMGLTTTWVADTPCYFVTEQSRDKKIWVANVLYEATVAHYDFTPSDECVAIRFANQADIKELKTFPQVPLLAEMFDPKNHIQN